MLRSRETVKKSIAFHQANSSYMDSELPHQCIHNEMNNDGNDFINHDFFKKKTVER